MVSKRAFDDLALRFCVTGLLLFCIQGLFAGPLSQERKILRELGVSVNGKGVSREVAWATDLSFLLLGRSLTENEITRGFEFHNGPRIVLGDLERFAANAGLDAEVCRLTWERLLEIETPVIAWLKGGKLGVVDPLRKGSHQVRLYNEPGLPGIWMRRNEIERIWNGGCLVLSCPKATRKIRGPSARWKRLMFDFGTVGSDYQDGIAFEVQNVGDKPLSLDVEKVSCSCVAAKFDTEIIPPGGTSILRLQTDFTELRGRHYSFTVLVSANDGRKYVARTIGQLLLSRITSTKNLHFGNIAKGGEGLAKFHIYDRGTHDLRFKEARIVLGKECCDGIEASVEFTHWGGLSYVGDVTTDITIEPGDYIASVKVSVDRECPQKTLKGLLVLTTNQEGELNELEIPIDGKIIASSNTVSGMP